MRIRRAFLATTLQDGDAFGRRVTSSTERSDLIGIIEFPHLIDVVAHEAAALHAQFGCNVRFTHA